MKKQPPVFKMVTYAFACDGFVKVGRTETLERRSRQIQLGCPFPVSLVGSIDGDIERKTHVALGMASVRRVHGEWFEDSDETRAVLARLGFTKAAP